MENLNRVTYKNSKGMVATCKDGEEVTQYLMKNLEIVEIEYVEVEKEIEIIQEVTSNEIEVVVYHVKDDSERFESLMKFERWLRKD